VNTGTTIVTFLMVFSIQHAQSHDTRASRSQTADLGAMTPSASARYNALTDDERGGW